MKRSIRWLCIDLSYRPSIRQPLRYGLVGEGNIADSLSQHVTRNIFVTLRRLSNVTFLSRLLLKTLEAVGSVVYGIDKLKRLFADTVYWIALTNSFDQ